VSLAKKMFIPEGIQVPCVNLPTDVELQDIYPWAGGLDHAKSMVLDGKSPSLFVFVENSSQLYRLMPQLEDLWQAKVTFWLFYPKTPHYGTDLSRDETWKIMRQAGLHGTRQIAIDGIWSCLYFKNSGKLDYVELVTD
jgi:hypothetical protein